MAENNQQYKWRQRKKRNLHIAIWLILVILASAAGTFVYEGIKDGDPQKVAENYIQESAGVQEYKVEAGERSLNPENQFVQDYTFTYTADGADTVQKVSLAQQSEKKYGLFEQWQIVEAGADKMELDVIAPADSQVLIDRTVPGADSVKADDTLSPGAVCYHLTDVEPTSTLMVNGLPFDTYETTLENAQGVLDVRDQLSVSENAKTQMTEIGKSMIQELYSAAADGLEASSLSDYFAQVPTKENLFRMISRNLSGSGELKVKSLSCKEFQPTFGEVYYPGRDEESFIGIEMKLAYTCEYEPAEEKESEETEEETNDTEAESETESETETAAGTQGGPVTAQKEATFYFRYQDGNCTVTSAEVPGVI